MENFLHGIWVLIVAVVTALYFLLDRLFIKNIEMVAEKVSFDSAKESINRISNWATWLVGLQTAAMASMLYLAKEEKSLLLAKEEGMLPKDQGFLALLFFGSSIILSTWLLSSLPSIQQRLKEEGPNPQNDIYLMNIFSFIPIRLGRFSGIVHFYFLIGIIFYALFIYDYFY